MKVEAVKIKNFRQFFGDVEISFSIDEVKNITVIHGENGVGKTALLNAVKWAFFQKLTNNFRDERNLVNNVAQKNGINVCSVEVLFSENGEKYSLLRRHTKGNRNNELKLHKINDNGISGSRLDQPQLIINSMLPEEMAEYFFFQGEGSNAVEVGNKGSNLAKSIRDILGFRVAQQLIKELEKRKKEIRYAISMADSSGQAAKLERQITAKESKLKQYEDAKKVAEELVPKKEGELADIERQFRQIENKDLSELRRKEKDAEQRLKIAKNKADDYEKERYSNIGKYGWAVFAKKFANISLDFVDEAQLKGRLPEPYNQTFIEDILQAQECICGCKLTPGSEALNKITSMLEKAANPTLLDRLSGIRSQVQDINTLCDIGATVLPKAVSQYDSYDVELQKAERDLASYRDQIKVIPVEEIQRLSRIKSNLLNDIKVQSQAIGKAKENIDRLIGELRVDRASLLKISPDTTRIAQLKSKLLFLETLVEFIESHLSKTENNIRKHVLAQVNDTLGKFSRHDFKIRVNESDFSFVLLDKDDIKVAQGDGLNLLLNLTITAALISFVQENRKVRDPLLTSATVAPLLIDAPFGVLDTKYRSVVVELLPKYAEQVVFLVSSSQWTEDMDEYAASKIGKEYNLILEESSEQGDKESDSIQINKQDYVLSKYGCAIDRTVVEEVIR